MNQAVIFDMDGTLFQTNQVLESALEETFEYLRKNGQWEGETPLKEYQNIMGVPLPEVWETLLPKQNKETQKKVDQLFLANLVKSIEKGKGALYSGTENLLKDLHDQGYDIFIASNGLVDYLDSIVSYYQLNRWVKGVYSIELISSNNKSDLVEKIIEENKVTSGAVVGDRLSDIRAAKDNGLVAIGCSFDFSKPEEMKKADYVITSLNELTGTLALKY
ncbi:HAD hydrolase-like protein [Halalkalibacillus halophilus]|uniref:HAD hydrolase-like protein n=1 Tax=Halalkalibacillus halophilus TaxID=392827 RepID=UPI00040264A2|nr:HAD hydrolase-like protein [Halalkalibacillus halophilus]